MNQKKIVSAILAVFLLPCMSMTVFANSSWHWVANNPLTVLPWAILGTLIVETFIICYYNNIKNVLFPFIIIVLANLLSFLTPYLFWGGPVAHEPYKGFIASINHMASKFPMYIVGVGFLILTLAVEIPVVYNFLKKRVQDKKRLSVAIISANVITAVAVAIVERFFCRGSW